jgi:peptidoglycan L-alanyl-D-glutamate endopeptidase CwlK
MSVVEDFDCTIIEGARSEEDQNRYFNTGKSKVRWPNGKHCKRPSQAVDVAPFKGGKISWVGQDCVEFGEFVVSRAKDLGIAIRWGGDWDGDGDRSDQTFDDLVHFELR